MVSFFSKKARKSNVRRWDAVNKVVEPLEKRLFLTASSLGVGPGVQIEYTSAFGPYMGVDAAPQARNTAPYYANYSNWGFVEIPISTLEPSSGAPYAIQSTSGVNSFTLSLDNSYFSSAATGEYNSVAGTFGVYIMQDDPTAGGFSGTELSSSNLYYGVGANRIKGSTSTDLAALGSNFGTEDNNSLEVTSADLIGTFTIGSAVPVGYSSWTFTGLSSAVQSTIAYDINQYADDSNSSTPLMLAIVSEGTGASGGAADWYGSNAANEEPNVQMDLNEVPGGALTEQYNTNDSAVNVDETSGNVEIDVLRNGFTGDSTTVDYTLGGGTATSANYTGTGGTLTFAAGQTQTEISVPILDASPQGGNKTFTVTLTSATPSQADDTGSIGSSATTAVTIIDSANVTSDNFTGSASTAGDIEESGQYTGEAAYGPVNGGDNGTGSFEYNAFEVYEFDPTLTPSLFAGPGQTITGISNLTLSINNSATTGNYAGHEGNFSVWFIPDTEGSLPTSGMFFGGSQVQSGDNANQDYGLSGTGDPTDGILIGTFSFDNQTGTDVYTPASLSGTVESDIVSDMNSGTAFRFAVTPGSTEFAADWYAESGADTPQLGLTATYTQTPLETVSFDQPSYTTAESAGGNVTIKVDRIGSDGATLGDTETVDYATSDGTATAGYNYTAESGTLTFGPGVTTATFTVPITDLASEGIGQGGDKLFNITLSDPTVTVLSNTALLGTNSSTTVTITDTTDTESNQESLQEYTDDAETIQVAGPFTDTSAEPSGSSSALGYAGYLAADFNTPGGGNVFTPSATVTAIDNMSLQVWNSPTGAEEGTSGPLQVYLVSDSTSNIDPSSPQSVNPHFYDTTQEPNGFGTQFGTAYLLGNVEWNAASTTSGFTSLSLANYNQLAEDALIQDLNQGVEFRLIVAPGNSTVFAKWGNGVTTIDGQSVDPQFTFGVTEATPTAATVLNSSVGTVGSNPLERSTVTGASVSFNDPVNFALSGGNLTGYTIYQEVLNQSGSSYSVNTGATPTNVTSDFTAVQSTNGRTLTLSVVPGSAIDRSGSHDSGYLANGIYQLLLNGDDITDTSGTVEFDSGGNSPVSYANNIAADGDTSQYFEALYGDLQGNGHVNLSDYIQFANSYLSSTGSGNYNPALDYYGTGTISLSSYVKFASDYLTTYSY
jgi:hypothetical protein